MPIPVIAGRSVVVPARGLQHLRCGNCGGLDFGLHVEPLGRGGAVAREAVCRGCRKVYRLRPDSGSSPGQAPGSPPGAGPGSGPGAGLTFERTGESTNLKGDPMT